MNIISNNHQSEKEFPRALSDFEKEALFFLLPENKSGYLEYKKKISELSVIGFGRFSDGNLILGKESDTINPQYASTPVFAIGSIIYDKSEIYIVIHEEDEDQIEIDISSKTNFSTELKEIKRWTYSNWIPGQRNPVDNSSIREISVVKNDVVLAVSSKYKKIWVFEKETGINHFLPITNFYNELMKIKKIRIPDIAFNSNLFFEKNEEFTDQDIASAFILYNKFRKKINLDYLIIRTEKPKVKKGFLDKILKEVKLSIEQIILKGREVIQIEAAAVARLEERINEDFANAVKVIAESKGRVVLTGLGKSGLIARKIVATLNSTGTAAIYLHPTDALHGDLGMVRKDDVVILISKSGNTEELTNLIPLLKRLNIFLIGMLGEKNSNIGKECNIVLNISVKEEACPYDLAPTASSTATLVMGDALSIALLEYNGFTKEDFALLHPGGSLGKRLSLKISELMITGDAIPIVNRYASIKDTILEITSKRLGVTAVVDNNGCLTGIITDGDLRRLLEKTLDIKEIKAEDIMTRSPKTIKSEFLASFALQIMESKKITSLIVIDNDGRPEGIIHLHDLLKLGLQAR